MDNFLLDSGRSILESIPTMSYESDQLLSEYLLMHYGTDEQLMPWGFGPKDAIGFPVRTVTHFPEDHVERALDLGCAVGRSTFELSKSASETIGIDFSANFIAAAEHLRSHGSIDYPLRETGSQTTPATAVIPDGSKPCRQPYLPTPRSGKTPPAAPRSGPTRRLPRSCHPMHLA
jgi:hypothetical protein